MKGGFLLNIVIRKCATILKLLPSENQALLIWRDAFLVLDFRLDIVDRIGRLHLQGDGLASESLDKNLHATAEAKNQMKSRLLLNVIVRESAAIFELLSGEDQSLLVWRNPFLVLNLGFDIVDGIRLLAL